MFFIMGITLYSSRVILKMLGVDDYGVYNVVGGIVVMLGFLNQTLSVGSQRFITFALGKNDCDLIQTTFQTSLFIYAILIGAVIVLSETVGIWYVNNILVVPDGRLFASNIVFQCTVLSCCMSFIQVPFLAEIMANEDMNIYSIVSIIEATLKLLSAIGLSIVPFDHLITYAVFLLITQFIVSSLYCTIAYKKYKLKISITPDKKLVGSMFSFCGWNMFGSVSSVLTTQGINMLLNWFFGPVCNAARGIAVQVNNAVNMFFGSFQSAVNPQITKLYANNEIEEEFKLIRRGSKFSFILGSLIVLPALLNMDYVLYLWLGDVPTNANIFSIIMLLQSLVLAMDRPIVVAIYATGEMKIANLTSGMLYLLTFPISFVLLKMGFEAYSVFLVAAILQPLILLTDAWVLRRYTGFKISSFMIEIFFPALLVFSICLLATKYLFSGLSVGIIKLFATTIFADLLFSMISLFILMSKSERVSLISIIKSKIKINND